MLALAFELIAAYLIEKGHKVEYIANFSADEADESSNPIEPTTFQVHSQGDPVSPSWREQKISSKG